LPKSELLFLSANNPDEGPGTAVLKGHEAWSLRWHALRRCWRQRTGCGFLGVRFDWLTAELSEAENATLNSSCFVISDVIAYESWMTGGVNLVFCTMQPDCLNDEAGGAGVKFKW